MNAIKYLAILPFIGMFIGPILHNSTAPYIFGLPFVLGWIVIWILITAVIMGVIYRLDPVRLHETDI